MINRMKIKKQKLLKRVNCKKNGKGIGGHDYRM
jgi:hypothetical protein